MTSRIADSIRIGQQTLAAEAAAISALIPRLDASFTAAVRAILDAPGRAVLTGMGKSGAIARKVASTFSSTGVPAFFLHPAEGVHGDLGAVKEEDIVIGFSYSGETDELSAILPALQRLRVPIIALTSRRDSTLGRAATIILDVTIEKEACPLNLAPTASTTAMLALGDALAMAAMYVRSFTREQFALYHPAGSLGRKLLVIDEIMRTGEDNVLVEPDAPLWGPRSVCWEMTRTRLGAAMVVDEEGKLLGIITDGDIRRNANEVHHLGRFNAGDVMTKNPRSVRSGRLASEALAIMQSPPGMINVLPVVDEERRVVGATHIQDLVQAGIV